MRTVETLMRVKRYNAQNVTVKSYENKQPRIIDVLIAWVATAILGGIAWICILEVSIHPEILEIIAVSGAVVALIVLVVLFANASATKDK